MILPLDFSFQLEKNDVAFVIDVLIKSIPEIEQEKERYTRKTLHSKRKVQKKI